MEASNIKITPVRLVFSNPLSGYKVLGCQVDENDTENPVVLNRFGNITISGSNLISFELGQTISVQVRIDAKSKYDGSYVVVGFPGITDSGERIVVDPNKELEILSRYMTNGQAENVNSAYPHFIEMVLNNEENQLDYHKIYNVGQKRIEEYIDKIKRACRNILFYAICSEFSIDKEEIISKLAEIYTTPEELRKNFLKNPYQIYIGVAGYTFSKTDGLVLNKFPELIDSPQRCEYAIREICEQNEYEGDTRINANFMYRFVSELVPECKQHIRDVALKSPLFYFDEKSKNFSLLETYAAECNIAEAVISRAKNPYVDENTDPNNATSALMGSDIPHTPATMNWHDFVEVDGFKCTEEQCDALEMITHNRVMVVSGSAGTGKSTWLKATVRMLEANGFSYMLLAPTGKAAGRMRETTGRDAMTIHMCLANCQNGKISVGMFDYIIIDEFSMVGVKLLSELLNQIGRYPNLVFVCDEAQLASISCGNIIQDLLDSQTVPVARFTKVFRYGIGGISTIATDIRLGEYKQNYSTQFPDLHMYSTETDDILEKINQIYQSYLDQGYKKEDIMILCPFNKSKIGCYTINNQIQAAFNPNRTSNIGYKPIPSATISFAKGDRVLCTHNNYKTPSMEFDDEGNLISSIVTIDEDGRPYNEALPQISVMNGDIGYIIHINDSDEKYNMAVQYDTGIALVQGEMIEQTQLGYAMSIHKSQGSQAKAVIMVMDSIHMKMLSRNLLYVGVSRASESLTIIGKLSLISEAIQIEENKTRDTWLKELLIEADRIFPEKLVVPNVFTYRQGEDDYNREKEEE